VDVAGGEDALLFERETEDGLVGLKEGGREGGKGD
jgi:hypothetical protein